jgi:hypothetical protein
MSDDKQSKAADMVRKVLTLGVGTLFLTEEALRGLVGELKVPKELIGGILQSANRTKNEFLQQIAQEVMGRLKDKVDPSALVQEILSRNDIEFQVKVSFKPREEASSRPAGAAASAARETDGQGESEA